ncbi:hypothetical protein ACLMJK_002303 [Lecanora helva]
MHRRLWSSISRKPSEFALQGQNGNDRAIPNGDSPEASVARGVSKGEEVLHLPVIVEAAESSPLAATEAAVRIRKFLSKENYQRAYVQYNAIMLMRILADNPGKSFTRNLDGKFVGTVKELLRDGRDMSVQQILRETLDNFEKSKAQDETLTALREMWKKEQAKSAKGGLYRNPASVPFQASPPQPNYQNSNYFARDHRPRGLPPPAELAQRVEEAKTSAKLLSQVVQSTPAREVLSNDLIKEFVDRCLSASRSIQGYIHSDNPTPDEDTLLTLIETNDQLAAAISRHQRAMLQARSARALSATPSPNPPPAQNGPFEAPVNPPAGPPPQRGLFTPSPGPPPGRQPQQVTTRPEEQNPFGDQNEHTEEMMPPPLSPSYGLPPATVGGGKANDQGAVYRPEYHQSTSNASNVQGTTTRNRDGADEDDDDEGMRRPVQYRF